MPKNRIMIALAVLALALSTFALDGPAGARGASVPGRPKVGQCRTTTFAQGYGLNDTHRPVPCSKPHRLKTFAVASLPKGINALKASENTWGRQADAKCTRPFWKALGSSFSIRDQSAYTWSFFIPTRAQIRHGARWIRCDLSLQVTPPGANSEWALLPNVAFPMIGSRPLTDSIRKCLSDSTHRYITTCSKPHAARADQTFVMNSSAFPSGAAIQAAANTHCPGKRFTTSYPFEWKLGDHTVTCYSVTTS